VSQTAADILVERLIDWGVKEIFGLNGIMEELRKRQRDAFDSASPSFKRRP